MMSSKKSAGYVCATIGIVFAVGGGCLGGEEVGEEEGASHDTESDDVEATYSVQVVDLDRGGIIVYEGFETAAERQRIVDGEYGQSADAITKIDPCFLIGENPLELYSATSLGGARICFSGTGVADLNNYCLLPCLTTGGCCNTWAGEVKSFKTGSYDAGFGTVTQHTGSICCQYACAERQDGATVNTATACEQGADLVDRGDATCDSMCIF